MTLCEVHELDEPGVDNAYCVKCATPEFAIIALADVEEKLDGLVDKFGGDGQAYQGPQFWQDRVDSIGRALTESNNQMATERRKHLDTSNWALEQQDRANLSEIALADAKRWVDVYRMLRNAHKHHRRALLKRVAVLEKALNQDEHYCVFDDNGWSIEHLVSCRPNMTDCEFHKRMHETPPLLGVRGRCVMKLTASGLEFIEINEK